MWVDGQLTTYFPQNYKFGWPPRIRTLIRRVKADCPAVERGAIMYSSIRKTYLRVKCFIYTRFRFLLIWVKKSSPLPIFW